VKNAIGSCRERAKGPPAKSAQPRNTSHQALSQTAIEDRAQPARQGQIRQCKRIEPANSLANYCAGNSAEHSLARNTITRKIAAKRIPSSRQFALPCSSWLLILFGSLSVNEDLFLCGFMSCPLFQAVTIDIKQPQRLYPCLTSRARYARYRNSFFPNCRANLMISNQLVGKDEYGAPGLHPSAHRSSNIYAIVPNQPLRSIHFAISSTGITLKASPNTISQSSGDRA